MTVSYIQTQDAQAQLNAQAPDAGGNLAVFGLPVAEATLQAHVEYANLYVNAIVGADLAADDPRFGWAKLAALNLACLRTLVAASGGMLTGASDYRLGDLYITKTAAGKLAFDAALQGFRDDLQRAMANLSAPVVAAESAAAGEVPTYRGGLINP